MSWTVRPVGPVLAALLVLASTVPVAGASADRALQAPEEAPERLVAMVDEPTRDLEALDGIEHAVHAVSHRPPAASIVVAPGQAEDALEQLRASEHVSSAYRPAPVEARSTFDTSNDEDQRLPDDPYFDAQWAPEHVNLPEAWAEHGFGSHDVEVAIVGGGIAAGHEDLQANVCRDLAGSSNHETRAAGMAAAVVNNTRGKAGAANACLVDMPLVQAGGLPGTDIPGIEHGGLGPCDGSGEPGGLGAVLCGEKEVDPLAATSTDLAFALLTATAMDVDVVSVSFGADRTPLLDAVLTLADARGVDLFFAAPNHEPCDVRSEAAYTSMVTAVRNVDSSGDPGSPCPGLAAPGVDVLTTEPGGKYARVTGTSYATPLAAGIAALMHDAGVSPGTAGEVLEATADEAGVVDAARALDASQAASADDRAREGSDRLVPLPHP